MKVGVFVIPLSFFAGVCIHAMAEDLWWHVDATVRAAMALIFFLASCFAYLMRDEEI